MRGSALNTILLLINLSLFNGHAQAMDEAHVPEDKRTTLGLYLSAYEASDFMLSHGKYALFIDVRDPHELQTTGMADAVDYNIPYNYINTGKWDDKKSRFQFDDNASFIKDVSARYKTKGLKAPDAILVMCTSGTRAASATNALAKAGYKNVHTVVDGYNGWQNNHLKWSHKLDRSKMYGKIAVVR